MPYAMEALGDAGPARFTRECERLIGPDSRMSELERGATSSGVCENGGTEGAKVRFDLRTPCANSATLHPLSETGLFCSALQSQGVASYTMGQLRRNGRIITASVAARLTPL